MAAIKSNKYLTEKVRITIANEIAQNNAKEVFFKGVSDDSGCITDVEALAWGNETSTPAIISQLVPGTIVLHNHPSGDLDPSEADIQVASIVGNRGVGFYIIDNAAGFLNIVVKGKVEHKQSDLRPDEISGWLDEKSPVAQNLEGYESRQGQIEMGVEVAESFNNGTVAMIEAGTGTGKTLAYLIPAILWAVKNKERIVVSTKTINLQEQLVHKDIPFLNKVLDRKFSSVLVKGRRNYACLRKIDAEERNLGIFEDLDDTDELLSLIKWSKSTGDGSLSDLNFIPRHETWDRLKCESDTCTGVRCAFYDDCFLVNARRKAANADILIVNHHLLFADLSLRGNLGSLADIAVLPPYKRIIIDEAHHIEEASTEYFGRQVSQVGLDRLFSRLISVSKKGGKKGLLVTIMAKLNSIKEKALQKKIREVSSNVEKNLMVELTEIKKYNDDIFLDIASFLERKKQNDRDEKQIILDESFEEDAEWRELILVKIGGLIVRMKEYAAKVRELAESLNKLTSLLRIDMENLLIELQAQLQRISDAADSFHYLVFEEDTSVVKWIEISGKQNMIKICAAPIEVGEPLRNALFDPYESIILTSATLTVADSFEFIKSRLGIDSLEDGRVTERSFPSPFSFREQALIGIPVNNHPPDHPEFNELTRQLIAESLKISRGRAFVLFTSYAAMHNAFDFITDSHWDAPITFLKQGADTRHNLLSRFKTEKAVALFATDSFWEGVDVVGDSLESIIITRLPFKVPTAPIERARRDAIDRAGGNSFLDYAVPNAVIKFKQGFGRLIRHKSDRGTVLVLDNRIVNKRYGRMFLDSLPDCRVVIDRDDVVFQAFREFYETR